MRQIFYVGYESANSFIKAASDKSEKVSIYRNTLTNSSKEEYNNNLNGLSKKEDKVYEIEGKYYKVGKNITDSKEQTTSSSSNTSRYSTPEYKIESLIAIFGEIEDHLVTEKNIVKVVTGVPTLHALDQDVEDTIKKSLEGKHIINSKEIYIQSVDVISQGEATFYGEVFTDNATINNDFVLETSNPDEDELTKLLYIDIGHGTTDFRVVNEFSTYETDFAQMTGMMEVWRELYKKLMKDKKSKLREKKPVVLGLEKHFRHSGKFNYKGVDVDIAEDRENLLQKYANDIIQKISSDDSLRDLVFDQIRITGGGSILLRKGYLQNAIEEVEGGDEQQIARYVFLDEEKSQISNVLGYLRYCYYIHNN